MPFKSEAQRRKFYAMADRGEISKSKVAEYEKATKGELPEHARNSENAENRGNRSPEFMRRKHEEKRLAKKRAKKVMKDKIKKRMSERRTEEA